MAVDFNGQTDALKYAYYTTGNEVVSMGDDLTVFAWVKLGGSPGALGTTVASCVNVPPGFGGFNNMGLFITQSRLVWTLAGGNPGFQEAFSGSAIPLNTWTAIAASISQGSLKAYLNGVAGTENTTAWSGGTLEDTAIGAMPTNTIGTWVRPWQDCIAYVTMWDRVLSPASHVQLASGVPPSVIESDGTILYVPFADAATASNAILNGSQTTLDFKAYNADPSDTTATIATCVDGPPILNGGSAYVRIMG